MKISPVLKVLRNERGLARRLADELGISKSAVWKWQGDVPDRHALKVARFLRIQPHEVSPDLYPEGTMRRRARRVA